MRQLYVITGGGSGIGQALAVELASCDKDILIVGRDMARLEQTKALYPRRIDCVSLDLTHESNQLIDSLQDENKIAGLIHNAAMIEPIAPLGEITMSQWKNHFSLNLDAPLSITQSLLKKLTNGRILMISSGAAHSAIPCWAAYCCSKAALHMLYQCFKAEYPDIGFASVMPGIVDTNMQTEIRASKLMKNDDSQFFSQLKLEQKLIAPKTVAKFLAWLLLDVDKNQYSKNEWDIYDTSHHQFWCSNGCSVPPLEKQSDVG
jgi:benzil reductase ((S)-benzoin forming)